MNKSHLLFKNPKEGVVTYKGRPGGGGNKETNEAPNYEPMANTLSDCLQIFSEDIRFRYSKRNLNFGTHFDLIELFFQGSFNQEQFQGHYINNFGLLPMRFTLFNRKVLFAIEDMEKFDFFLLQLTNFIERYTKENELIFDGKIKYIKSFKLYSTEDMLGNINNHEVIHLSFLGGRTFIEDTHIIPQKQELEQYLTGNNISYHFSENSGEIYDIDDEILRVILNNFDFIYATCSGSGAIIQPSMHNTPQRTFDFEITNAEDDLPIIGIIDSGISNETPLAPIIVGEDNEFNITDTSSFRDDTDHGTGVSAFAAFGTKLIPNYHGEVEADAKILPLKIINAETGAISQRKVIDLIRRANLKYNVRIFTLTVGYTNFPLNDNEEFSSYARMLDELTAELDILIFISTTNTPLTSITRTDYPDKFKELVTNIAPPAESMNNITIGATANNYEDNDHRGLAFNNTFPTIYSRKHHYNYKDSEAFNSVTQNKYLRKPDIIVGGGDYSEFDFHGSIEYFDEGSACIEVLSSNLTVRTYKTLGTSYSTPIAANMAAKLVKLYPYLNMQTIKALMINSSEEINTGDFFTDFNTICKNRIFGHGTPNYETLFTSTNNKVTLIIEDEIIPETIKSFPIRIPEYLKGAQKKFGVLKISSTLTFKFKPKLDNQLLYCPVHLTYAIGKNLELDISEEVELVDEETGEIVTKTIETGYNGNSTKKIKLISSSTGWVQDFYYKNKVLSNVQKSKINIAKQAIIDEDNTFKIAINSALHKQLTNADKLLYNNESISYSLIITIEQIALSKEKLGSLYDGLIAENTLEVINDIDLEAELDNIN